MKKVLLLFGGKSNEHEVSCKSAKSILKNIDHKLFEVTSVGITEEGKWLIYKDEIEVLDKNWQLKETLKIENIVSFILEYDIVFPVIHGNSGEDGKLQGFLEMFDIKYVGPNVLASAIGMDKEYSKIIFNFLGIPQVPYICIKDNYKIKEIETMIKYPMIVKPCNSGSSIGVSKVNNKKQLIQAIKDAKKIDKKVIIEKFIKGKELECAILENKKVIASDVGEIIPANAFYDYEAKYNNSNSKTIIPANIPKEIKKQIQEYAINAFNGIGAKGLSRVDFFYDQINKEIYLNEINTSPGFTEISMFPSLFIDYGYTYKELITFLLK